jgi:two-component system response regulator YesN
VKYSVFIADDEPLARKGLGTLIRSRSAEWEVRGLFSDGSEALSAARKSAVDVILADVRMPRIDGLELARALRIASPDTVIIVMSGYREFDYACRALKSGVIDFLVKPIEEGELFSALDRARAEIERRRALRRQSVVAKDPDGIKDALLAEVLTAAAAAAPATRLCEFLGIDLGRFVAVCAQVTPPVAADDVGGADWANLERRLQTGPDAARFHTFSFQGCLVVIAEEAFAESRDGPEASGLRVAARISSILGRSARVGVSLPHHGSGQIRAACEEGLSAMQDGYYGSPGGAFRFVPCTAVIPRYPESAAEKIAACLVAGDPAACETCAREVLGAYSRDRVPLTLLDEHLRAVMSYLQERLAPVLPDPVDLRALCDSVTPVQKHGWFDRLQAELLSVLRELCARVQKAHERRLGRAVARAIQYIEDNYCHDLPLEEVAKSVSLSASYFSSSFKKETGKSFVEYVTEFRIERASELLCSTNLNTSEVAYRVGFNDPKYFARIFRRSVGVNPSEYRKYSQER